MAPYSARMPALLCYNHLYYCQNMNTYQLNLVIANIRLLLKTCNHKDYIFLQKQYQSYIYTGKQSHKPVQAVVIHKLNKTHKIVSKDNTYTLYCSSAQSNFFLFSYYLRQIFLEEMTSNGGVILHASSLIYNGKAYVFIGKSGAGKTTIRGLFPELSSLGDDIALINKKGNVWYLWGSPFFQRSRTIYPNLNIPIAFIYEIIQSPVNKKQKLSTNQALRCFFKYSYSASKATPAKNNSINTLFKTWIVLSKKILFYQLFFKNSKSCGSTIFYGY
jgi:hypothetical protein